MKAFDHKLGSHVSPEGSRMWDEWIWGDGTSSIINITHTLICTIRWNLSLLHPLNNSHSKIFAFCFQKDSFLLMQAQTRLKHSTVHLYLDSSSINSYFSSLRTTLMNPQLHVCLWNLTSVLVLFQFNDISSPEKCDWRHKIIPFCLFFLTLVVNKSKRWRVKLWICASSGVSFCLLRAAVMRGHVQWSHRNARAAAQTRMVSPETAGRTRVRQLITWRISALGQMERAPGEDLDHNMGFYWFGGDLQPGLEEPTTAPEEEFIHPRIQILQIPASLCASGCHVGFFFFLWVTDLVTPLWTETPTCVHFCPPKTARLDPEVPPRNDPESDVMGKTIRHRVTKDYWKV